MTKQRDSISLPEAADVLRSYSVGRLQFKRPAAGTANPAVIVVTDKGQFFLKRRNPRYSSTGQLVYDHDVIRHLAQSGLPVHPPVRTLKGSRWLIREESTYELYTLVEGRPHQPGNTAQIHAAGACLARFHQATERFEAGGEKPLPRLHDPKDAIAGLDSARSRDDATPESRAAIEPLIDTARAVLRRLPDEAYRALPQCVIHGDYHPANLKFDGDEIVGVFDFDWVGLQPRVVDFADGLTYFCGIRERPMDPADITSLTQAFTLDEALVNAFGRGYAEGISPTPKEFAALPDLLRSRWLFSRVDAMDRKIPDERKLDYLLEDIEKPLTEIDRLAEWLSAGDWLS